MGRKSSCRGGTRAARAIATARLWRAKARAASGRSRLPRWRRRLAAAAYGAALLFGAAAGGQRLSGGAHFFSDVVFAGVFTFLVIWVVHGLIYRWRTRLSDEQVEGWIERLRVTLGQRKRALEL